jgi:O-antigen/teichoic acid export membrane protein
MRLPAIGTFDHHMREVARGAAVALILRVAGAGLTFAFNVVLARLLGADGAGIYFLALTLTTIASVFGRLGLDNALLRFTAAAAALSDWTEVRGVYRTGMSVAVRAAIAATLLTAVAAGWLSNLAFSKPDLAAPLRWMALAIIPMVVALLHAELLKGLKRIAESVLISGVSVPALSLIGLLVLAPRWGVIGAVWAYAGAGALTAAVAVWLWVRATPQARRGPGSFARDKLLRTSLPLLWVKSMNLAMGWTATIVLGIWATSADVGIFNAASRTVLLGGLVLMAVNSIAAPKFAALHREGDMKALNSMARSSAILMLAIASPLLLAFTLAPGPVMRLFGPEFVAGAPLLVILALGQFVNVATGSVGYLLMMTGHEKLMRNSVAIAAALNLVLNLVLVPIAGTLGAAIATAISLATLNLVATYYSWSRLGIVILPLVRSRVHG